jgi:response regulator RpfG family c-di-GMP phosphodiesterase
MPEILIVDDKDDELQVAKDILADAGYTVHPVGTQNPYQHALDTWEHPQRDIRLALVGLNLPPGNTGFDRAEVAFKLIRELKERPNARVAVYSNSTTPDDLQNAVQSGADGFIARESGRTGLLQGVGYLRYLPDYWRLVPGRETTEHTLRIYNLCRNIIPSLRCDPDDIDLGACFTATIIHDMGHVYLSQAVRDAKPLLTTPELLEEFLGHIDRVYTHCMEDPILKVKIAEIVRYHHRSFAAPHPNSEIGRRDYPRNGHRREEIPLEARVIHVLDVFDAFLLTPLGECGRNPRAVVDWMQSREEIKCLDQSIVNTLAQII